MVRHPLSKSANRYLRKFRKWPHSPYKTSWHHNFGEQQAMQILKQATIDMGSSSQQPQRHRNPSLLSTLIDSFKSYSCEPTPKAYYFVIKTLTNTSQLQDIPPILDHLEHMEKFEIPESIFLYLIKFYGLADRVQDAVDLFFRIPRFRFGHGISGFHMLPLLFVDVLGFHLLFLFSEVSSLPRLRLFPRSEPYDILAEVYKNEPIEAVLTVYELKSTLAFR